MTEIIEEKPITMAESLEDLKVIEVRNKDKELDFRAKKSKDYFKTFVSLKKADIEKIRKALQELNLPRLKERHIVKIIDIMPTDLDSLKMLLSGEAISPKTDDLKKILDAIKPFQK